MWRSAPHSSVAPHSARVRSELHARVAGRKHLAATARMTARRQAGRRNHCLSTSPLAGNRRENVTDLVRAAIVAAVVATVSPSVTAAQDTTATVPAVVCTAKPGERQSCAADTRAGVTLLRSIGTVPCILGVTWGYDQNSIWVSDGCSAAFALGKVAPKSTWGTYTPGGGFKVANTEWGDLGIKIFTYVRYLNQTGLDPTYTNAFGTTSNVQQRQDIQVNKVNITFLGWVVNPKFRYRFYVWTTNVSMGAGGQVIVAGFLSYTFSPYLLVGAGVQSLPGVRSTEGNFPFWLPVDNRLIADEFFRPSYTTGIFATGKIVDRFSYNVMLGNNLSQMNIDAGQLDNKLATVSGVIVWMPTTGEFGPAGGFGDFEYHEHVATKFGAHYTYSQENYQNQPDNDDFQNVQIRLSNGGIIFAPNLFGPGIRVQDALYQMADVDAGIKYRGFALEGEYYTRWINDFRGPGTGGLAPLFDRGFQMQASGMVIPKLIQGYVSGSKIYGQYGDPSDFRVGINYFPFGSQIVRWNFEYLRLNHSPVGGLSLPYVVGGNGNVIYSSLQMSF
jgi:hypothetical protein